MISPPLVISGPTGIGKTTLIRQIEPYGFKQVVGTTTRAQRKGEVHMIDYEFTDKDTFLVEVAAGQFIMHSEIFGNLYGTKIQAVQNVYNEERIPVTTIYTPLVEHFMKVFPDSKTVYLCPSNIDFLAARLSTRQQSEEEFNFRLQKAIEDIEMYNQQYRHLFTNEIVMDSDDNTAVIETILRLYDEGRRGIESDAHTRGKER